MVNEKMDGNVQPDLEGKSSRKRVRKSLSNSMNMKQQSSFENVETVDLTVSDELPTLSKNHFSPVKRKLGTEIKKRRYEDDELEVLSLGDQPTRRSQPHRAARYTDSYSNIAGVDSVALSDEEAPQNGTCNDKEGEESSSSSDSDCEIIIKSPPPELSTEEQVQWENKVQELQKHLQYEDMKLLLLKKLKQSQVKKDVKKEEVNYNVPAHVKISQRPTPPTALDASSSLPPSRKLLPNSKTQTQTKVQAPVENCLNVVQDLTKHSKPSHHHQQQQQPSPSVQASSNLVKYSENLNRANITIHPVNTQNAAQRQKLPALNSIKNEVSISLVPAPSSSSEKQSVPTPPQAPVASTQVKRNKEKEKEQLTVQQQAAAKLMLQKEIKRTLMQIPNPKPTVERPQFLPNGTSQDFVWLLGLDLVVDYITKKIGSESAGKDPQECSQCKTSFTESWKTVDRNSSKSGRIQVTLCYACYCHSMKKKLRVDHTAQLKSAFAKILQYEKEIDKLSRMPTVSAPMSMSVTPSTSSSSLTSSSSSSYRAHSGQSYPQSMSHKPSSSTSSQRASSSSFPTNLFQGSNAMWFQQQFPKLTPQQLQTIFQQQAQNFLASGLQLSPHMLPFAPFLAAQYPYQMMNKSASSASDLQRQYLLDMIPSSPSAPQSHRKS